MPADRRRASHHTGITPCNMQHATCNMQHATCNMKHATCNIEHVKRQHTCAICTLPPTPKLQLTSQTPQPKSNLFFLHVARSLDHPTLLVILRGRFIVPVSRVCCIHIQPNAWQSTIAHHKMTTTTPSKCLLWLFLLNTASIVSQWNGSCSS